MIDKKMSAGIEKMNKIVQNKIQITLVESQYEDIVFSEIYQLINPTLKKKTIEKALIYFLKKSSDEVLEMFFGDDVEEAKKLAKKRVPRAKKPIRKKTIKKEVVENKPQIKDVTEEVIEEVLPTESEHEEEIIEPEVVIETPKTEVAKDDISSDEEIMNILKSHNTGSSTTEEKKGDYTDFWREMMKKREKKPQTEELSDEEKEEHLRQNINRFKAQFAERAKEDEERKKNETINWGKD